MPNLMATKGTASGAPLLAEIGVVGLGAAGCEGRGGGGLIRHSSTSRLVYTLQ